MTHDVATDTWTKTITGHRYFVNEPGSGVTVRDVGRIQYGDLEQRSCCRRPAARHRMGREPPAAVL